MLYPSELQPLRSILARYSCTICHSTGRDEARLLPRLRWHDTHVRESCYFFRRSIAHSLESGGAGEAQEGPDASEAGIRSPVSGLNHSTV